MVPVPISEQASDPTQATTRDSSVKIPTKLGPPKVGLDTERERPKRGTGCKVDA